MPRAALRGRLPANVPPEIAELGLTRLEDSGRIESEDDQVRRAGHSPTIDPESRATLEQISREAREAGLDPPSPRDWAQRLGVNPELFRDLVAHLERDGVLIRAPGDLWFSREAVDALRKRVVAQLEADGEIDTAAYKQLTGTSRRTTVPLMELFDELHLTRRQGDVRVLRRRGPG
jgi:selenocysteine-specific elongation factor